MIKAQYTNEEHTQIAVKLDPGDILGNFIGPVEFSVGMQTGNKEHDELEMLVANEKVKIYDFVPSPPPFIDEISDRQFFQQLAIYGDITKEEALAAVKTGSVPSALQEIINNLPEESRFNAEMLISGATIFRFSNPITLVLGAAMNRTPEQMKQLWIDAANLL